MGKGSHLFDYFKNVFDEYNEFLVIVYYLNTCQCKLLAENWISFIIKSVVATCLGFDYLCYTVDHVQSESL